MQLVPIDKLIPYINNVRTHSPEQLNKLRSSLREFGFINPVIIDRDFNVIAGHGRILAAKAENISEVPCVFVDYLTPAQKKAYIIADNRMALDAGWDEEMLKVEIEALQADDFDLSLTGFDEKELAAFFDDDSDTKDDDFDVDAEMEKPFITKLGDLWLLGNHRLVCGDSTKQETYEVLMNGKQANLVVTDPPYNVNYEGSAGKIKNDNLENEKFYQFLLEAFTCMEKSMANDSYHTEAKENLANTLVASDYKDPPTVNSPEYIVRRLTPTECARLQGFPDWWCADLGTDEPTDEELRFWKEVFETHRKIIGSAVKPKSEKQIRTWLKNPHSDSAEYKLWGNGVALPCVYFVLSGIAWFSSCSN